MKKLNRNTWLIGMALAASATACAGNEPTDIGTEAGLEQEEGTRLIVGDYANLTTEEFREFQEDREYLRSLVGPDTPVKLNLADPRQHRLAMTRLKISGKSRDNSPNLFTTVERTRQEHVRQGYTVGSFASAGFREGEGTQIREQHFLTGASVNGTEGEAVATGTRPGGTIYSSLDVGYYDAAGVPLAAPNFVEQFEGGTDVSVQTDADLSQSNIDAYVADSFQIESTEDDFILSYAYTEMGLASTQPAAGRPTTPVLATPVVGAPIDVMNADDIISICLNRVWTGDCDYDLTGNWASVKVPLQGTISITSAAHVFSLNAIQDIKNDPLNHPRAGYIKLLLTQAGGGCDLASDGALQSSMQAFWNSVTISTNQKSLSWDLTGANAAFFDDSCRQVQDIVYLTMRLQLPVRDNVNNLDYWVSKTLSNNPAQFAPDFIYKDIKITNSCLAEGTMLQMADGSMIAVEDIAAGAQVLNSSGGVMGGLTVTDTAVGIETEPMVRLHADGGHSVLMTEMHPVETPDRGIVLAKDLEEGDMVSTVDGDKVLTRVAREEFGGKVYNVKLGTDMEKASLAHEDLTLVYANGFLVGDGQVQGKYEAIDRNAASQIDVLERLPAEWHLDYQLAPTRK